MCWVFLIICLKHFSKRVSRFLNMPTLDLTPNGISTVKAAFIFQLGEELDNAVILFCLAGHVDERQEFLDTHEHSVRWRIN